MTRILFQQNFNYMGKREKASPTILVAESSDIAKYYQELGKIDRTPVFKSLDPWLIQIHGELKSRRPLKIRQLAQEFLFFSHYMAIMYPNTLKNLLKLSLESLKMTNKYNGELIAQKWLHRKLTYLNQRNSNNLTE